MDVVFPKKQGSSHFHGVIHDYIVLWSITALEA